MKKIILFFILIFSIYACFDDGRQECFKTSDCDHGKACYDGLCFDDYCKKHTVDCGIGVCVAGTNKEYTQTATLPYGREYYCVCYEGAILKPSRMGYTCGNLGTDGDSCQVNGDCYSGYQCFSGVCRESCTQSQDCSAGKSCGAFNFCS